MENIELNRDIEENIMAILDTTGFKDSKDEDDDKLGFLEAVRATNIVPEIGTSPTNKMREAVFQILRCSESLELIMASYQLLIELDKRFPQVYVSSMDSLESSLNTPFELQVVKEAWSPFVIGPGAACSEKLIAGRLADPPLDSFGFTILVQGLAELAGNTSFKAISLKSLRKMLLLQYLVNFLEGDIRPRNHIYKETMDWTLLRESWLNMLLGSGRMSYKGLIKDCLCILFKLYHVHAELSDNVRYSQDSEEHLKDYDTAVSVGLLEIEKNTCMAVKKLLVMIMELDSSKKQADMQGRTTRVDGVRTPVMEIIVDELTYNRDNLFPFLQVFDEPQWKLEIVLQFFWKYIPKPAVRTRRSSDFINDITLGILKCFSNITSTKGVIKKLSPEVAQILVAHGFQAYLSLSSPKNIAGNSEKSNKNEREGCLVDVCKKIILAFRNIKGADEHTEIIPLGKEALFTAATILSSR